MGVIKLTYSSPTLVELGTIESLTLGSLAPGNQRDSFQWWWGGVHYELRDPWGDPSVGS